MHGPFCKSWLPLQPSNKQVVSEFGTAQLHHCLFHIDQGGIILQLFALQIQQPCHIGRRNAVHVALFCHCQRPYHSSLQNATVQSQSSSFYMVLPSQTISRWVHLKTKSKIVRERNKQVPGIDFTKSYSPVVQ